MAIDEDFLLKLRCPRTRKPLRLLPADRLAELNAAIGAGGVSTLGGRAVDTALDEALAPEGEDFVYAVDDGIPILLAEEAVPIPDRSAG